MRTAHAFLAAAVMLIACAPLLPSSASALDDVSGPLAAGFASVRAKISAADPSAAAGTTLQNAFDVVKLKLANTQSDASSTLSHAFDAIRGKLHPTAAAPAAADAAVSTKEPENAATENSLPKGPDGEEPLEAAIDGGDDAAAAPKQPVQPFQPVASNADDACASCCNGGSCVWRAQGVSQTSLTQSLQCCGVLHGQPKCCPLKRSFDGPQLKCGVDEKGYVCKSASGRFHIVTEASYLSVGGLIVIIIIGALIACCYCGLAGRRTYAGYNGQPMYAGGGGGGGGGEICAACLAGFCCTELCCTGNINF